MERVSTIKLTGVIRSIQQEADRRAVTLEYKAVLKLPGEEKAQVTSSTREVEFPTWCTSDEGFELHEGDKVSVWGNIGVSKNRTVVVVADRVRNETLVERNSRRLSNDHEMERE